MRMVGDVARRTWRIPGAWRWLLVLVALAGLGATATPATSLASAPGAGAAASSGGIWGWGLGSSGQLGYGPDGGPSTQATPRAVYGMAGVVAVSAGQYFTLAVKSDGTVWSWGWDYAGRLGDGVVGSPEYQLTPQQVVGLGGVTAVSAGGDFGLALKSDGTVWAWGSNSTGNLGVSDLLLVRPTPGQVPGLTGVVAISARGKVATALKGDGTLWAWGDDTSGQLGDGTIESTERFTEIKYTPQQVPGVTGITAVSVGYSHTLALKSDGTVLSWGDDRKGQLGRKFLLYDPQPTPAAVFGLSGVVAVSAQGYFSLALKADGTVWAWGSRTYGELGDGAISSDGTNVAQQVPGLTGVKAVSAGSEHALVLKNDGTVWAWGRDNNAALGDGTRMNPAVQPTPQAVIELTGAFAIDAGYFDSFALAPAALPTFGDVPAGDPAAEAIRQLAARGVIRGCDQEASPPLFCPTEPTLRAQMAALIVRAMGWGAETPDNPFADRCDPLVPDNCVDPELWNAVGVLGAKGVARGYTDGATCAPAAAPCYAARDNVLYAQTISFITRAMVEKGYWTAATVDDGTVYPNIPAGSGHRLDFVTYTQNVGPVPGTAGATEAFPQWDQPSTRAWFAQALWQAIQNR